MTTKLELRVKAMNAANALANEIYPKLVAIFQPLVGQKIEKNDGSLMAKYQKLVEELDLPNTTKLRVYRSQSNYSLLWKVCVYEWQDSVNASEETLVYIGEMRDGFLEKILDPWERKTYTVEGVIAARKDFEVKRKAFEAARSALDPFGEYDL